jgi:hypothetical protein
MKAFNTKFRTIATGITVIPALAFSMLVFGADNAQTPGAKEPADVDSRSVTPYVPPANVYVPDSSKVAPQDVGNSAHTNILIQNANGAKPKAILDKSQPKSAGQ